MANQPPMKLPPSPRPPNDEKQIPKDFTSSAPRKDAMFRVRKSRFGGKCILQKFDGDVFRGPPPGFRDVPWRADIGAFTIVPRADWDAAQKRIELADKRAKHQRDARKKKRDFEASRLAGEDPS